MIFLIVILLIIILSLLVLYRIRVKKLKVYKSPFLSNVEVFEKYNKELLLSFNGVHQGISTDNKSISQTYWYEMAKQAADFCQNKKDCQALMLGLGANTTTRILSKMNPKIHLIIVEIDEQVIKACQQFFHLDELPNYELIQADAYKLPEQKFKSTFDVILVDVFTNPESFIGSKSHSLSYIDILKYWLKDEGIIISNRQSHTPETLADIKKFKARLKKVFKKVGVEKVSDTRGYKNQIVTAYKLPQTKSPRFS